MERDFLISDAFFSSGPIRSDIHFGNEYEIIFITEGSVELRVNGKTYTAGENDLILLANLEQKHLRLQSEGGCSRYCVFFHAPIADAHLHNPELLNLLKNHSELFRHCLPAAPIREELLALLEKLMACRAEEPYANEMAAAYLSQLLILVARLYPQLHTDRLTGPGRDRILAVQRYIDRHFQEPLRISELCRQHYISTHYLSHQFKDLTGYSPKQYLTLLRLQNAAGLLHSTKLPVSEIALACGFSDINNFCKKFKSQYHCTPSELRAKR